MLGKCLSISHITFYVSNARQVAINYCLQYGFRPFRYRGLENGYRLQTSHAVINNDIILVFVSPLIQSEDNDMISSHIVRHGDGVRDVGNYQSIQIPVPQVWDVSEFVESSNNFD